MSPAPAIAETARSDFPDDADLKHPVGSNMASGAPTPDDSLPSTHEPQPPTLGKLPSAHPPSPAHVSSSDHCHKQPSPAVPPARHKLVAIEGNHLSNYHHSARSPPVKFHESASAVGVQIRSTPRSPSPSFARRSSTPVKEPPRSAIHRRVQPITPSASQFQAPLRE